MKKHTEKAIARICVIIFSIMLFFTAGCSDCGVLDAINSVIGANYWLQFKNSRLTLGVGDSVTIDKTHFLFEDGQPGEDWSFSLESENCVVADVAGREIHAVSPGVTKITATAENGKTAKLTVTVHSDVDQIQLGFTYGSALPTGGDMLIEAEVVDKSGKISLTDRKVTWSVNGVKSNYDGTQLTIPNQGKQVYLIEASVNSSASGTGKTLTARANACYYEGSFFRPSVEISNLSPVAGESVDLEITSGANYVADWYINGEIIASGVNSCSFAPEKAGYYDYEVRVYQEIVSLGRLTVLGSPEVSGIAVDVDKSYPSTVVSWDSLGAGFEYEIKVEQDGDTQIMTASQSSMVIDVDVTRDFTVNVRSLGDGVMSESEFSAEGVFFDGSRDALSYLQKTWHGGNYYLSDQQEFYEFFDYMMYYRPQPEDGKPSKSQCTVYIAFEGDVAELMHKAFAWSGATGSYTFEGGRKANIATLSMEFYTGNVPTKTSTYDKQHHKPPADLMEYHVSQNGGGVQYFLGQSRGYATVSTGEQLYRTVELGYYPVPEKGSAAESLLQNAYDILNVILDEDMGEYEIAHAIYDFIMAKNTYDGTVLNIELNGAVQHKSFYLDSVLSKGESYGVCDAMAKGYSLLCNVAGVDCVRVTGYAGTNGNYGGHAWNKVKIDGEWYVVDCTWGDVSVYYSEGLKPNATVEYMESASHAYFLLSDSDVAQTHVEDLGDYPKTAPVGYGTYAKLQGEAGDMLVQTTGAQLYAELDRIAYDVVNAHSHVKTVELYGIKRTNYFTGADFMVSKQSQEQAKAYLSSDYSNFFDIIREKRLSYTVLTSDDVFYLFVTSAVNMNNANLGGLGGQQGIRPPWYSWFL